VLCQDYGEQALFTPNLTFHQLTAIGFDSVSVSVSGSAFGSINGSS
jgi:hypothetical protein